MRRKDPKQKELQLAEHQTVWEKTPDDAKEKVVALLKVLILEEFRRRREVTGRD